MKRKRFGVLQMVFISGMLALTFSFLSYAQHPDSQEQSDSAWSWSHSDLDSICGQVNIDSIIRNMMQSFDRSSGFNFPEDSLFAAPFRFFNFADSAFTQDFYLEPFNMDKLMEQHRRVMQHFFRSSPFYHYESDPFVPMPPSCPRSKPSRKKEIIKI